MRLLVTGASGFVGGALLRMIGKTEEVVAIGRTRPKEFSGEWIEADLTQPLHAEQLPQHVDAVVHLAQSRKYRIFPDGAADVFAVNVASTAALLDWALRVKANAFLFASSGNVYGDCNGLAKEDSPLNPGDDYYGASKLAAEYLVESYGRRMATCNLRFYSIYGPDQPQGRLVASLINRVATRQAITLCGDGGGDLTQPTFIDDVAALICRALAQRWTGCVNVAGPEPASVRRLAELIGEKIGIKPTFRHESGRKPRVCLPDLARLRRLISDMSFTPLGEGIRHTIARWPPISMPKPAT